MLDEVEGSLCIDTSRVYAAGLSMGGFMSSAVGCAMSDRFAAVAPVAGLQFPEGCDPGRPVPVMAFHGTEDPILLFNGGVNTDALAPVLGSGDDEADASTTTTTTMPTDIDGPGYPQAAADWAEQNGCDGSSDEEVSDEVLLRTFDCPDGADVEFYIIDGGGHSWPGSEFSKSIGSIVGPTTFDIDATQLIWDFFSRFRLPA
jgi:polyhydroxybutyrate depolymerase